MSIESVMPSNHLILCYPLLLPSTFPASGSFPMSWFFAWGDQSIRASASASVVPISSGLIPLGWTGLISCSPRDSQVSSSTPQFKSINSSALNLLYDPMLTFIMTTVKTIALTIWTFVGKVMSLLFNMLSQLVIAFLPTKSQTRLSD